MVKAHVFSCGDVNHIVIIADGKDMVGTLQVFSLDPHATNIVQPLDVLITQWPEQVETYLDVGFGAGCGLGQLALQ